MNAPLWLSNLGAWAAQVALLVAACAACAGVLRGAEPRWVLGWWRSLLLASLLLPLLQPWRLAAQPGPPPAPGAETPGTTPPAAWDWADAVAAVLAAGAAARLSFLALGLLRLRLLRLRARQIELPAAARFARLLGVTSDLAVSDEIEVPVTFGARRPAILLPAALLASGPERQAAVVCHEMLHVRRRDWSATVAEECVRALLWFHPAIAWLLERIRLSREQLVDREVVALTGDRQAYLEALLDAARAGSGPRPVAALLPKASHLRERVDLLIEEVPMSKRRKSLAVALCTLVSLVAGAFSVRAFPLAAGVQDDARKPPPPPKPPLRLVHKVEPSFPEGGKKVRQREDVVLEVSIDRSGAVSDVKVVKGHPAFNEAAADAVRQWKFEPSEQSPAMATITIRFVPPPPPPPPKP